MTLLAASILALTAVVLACCRWWLSNQVLRTREHRTVIVTLKSGSAFRGALFGFDSTVLVLRNAELLDKAGPGPKPVDGEILVMRTEVDFIQRP